MATIVFQPSGIAIEAAPGVRLSDACRRAGFAIPVPCGGKGLCGKCRVRVLEGDVAVDGRQRACLSADMLAAGWRASCVVERYGDLVLADPVIDNADGVILTEFMGRPPEALDGLWRCDAAMAPPSTEDQRDDLARLLDALAREGRTGLTPGSFGAQLLARLPDDMRRTGFRCRVHGAGDAVLAVRDRSAARPLGLAVDLGTTTMAAALCDFDTGDVLAVVSRANPQAARGDDVITRVDYASSGPAEREEMRLAALKAIEEMAGEALRNAGVRDAVLAVAVGGNTVMNHLLLGVDPRALAVSPFIPAFRGAPPFNASQIGWHGSRPPAMWIVPNIAAYVGGDITAGVLAHGVDAVGGNVLFLDVGTNGEIVLASDGKVYACAAAAGPAFEGARIRQGMRAAPGAVSRVGLDADGGVEVGVVDDVRPARGICGTGLLDAVATLLRVGAVDSGGRMLSPDEAAAEGVAPAVAARLHEDADGPAFWLATPAGHGDSGVALASRDVRELQLAKGAIAAGVRVLLGVAGIGADDIDEVLLAGGFGNYLSPESALAVGLLPPEVPAERVRSVGNASLAGTRLYLLSEAERRRAEAISRTVEYIELSGREDFQTAFAEEMLFPEPD